MTMISIPALAVLQNADHAASAVVDVSTEAK